MTCACGAVIDRCTDDDWPTRLATAIRRLLLDSPPAISIRCPMRRVGLAVVLAVSLVFAPLAGVAQQTGKIYRIGYLVVSPLQAWKTDPRYLAFVEALRGLGWVEGQN